MHSTRFYRNPSDGTYRCICTCGFTCEGDRETVQTRAATHDLDEVEGSPTWRPPSPKRTTDAPAR